MWTIVIGVINQLSYLGGLTLYQTIAKLRYLAKQSTFELVSGYSHWDLSDEAIKLVTLWQFVRLLQCGAPER